MRFLAFIAAVLAFASCSSRPAPAVHAGRTITLTDSLLTAGISDTLRIGRLHSGETAVSTLQFINGTSEPVVITSYERSCGCTTLEYDARPLLPGETKQLRVIFDSRGEWGWQFRAISVVLTGREQPLRLFVEADVE